jgi:hypothetical protein
MARMPVLGNLGSEVEGPRRIRTVRTPEEINAAAERGLWPLIVEIKPNPEIRSKIGVLQNPQTGEISLRSDYRSYFLDKGTEAWEMVLPFTWYYPYCWEHPFAAYLIPPDIKIGERVIIEDVIEDIVGGNWSQGDTWRLASSLATWDGQKFVLDPVQVDEVIG